MLSAEHVDGANITFEGNLDPNLGEPHDGLLVTVRHSVYRQAAIGRTSCLD